MADPQTKPERGPGSQAGKVDEASRESFPASDAPALSGVTGPEVDPMAGGGDAHADEAKGTPHTDRHASETAAGRIESVQPAEHKHS